MKKIIVNILVMCCSILLFFALAEGIIRIFYSSFSNYNLEMWRYAVELKKPLPFNNLPFHHYANKEGFYYGVNIKTNSMGLREKEFYTKKEPHTKRILFLGDSFTLGWGVPFDSTFSQRVGRMLNKHTNQFQVINMGTCNYNSTMEVELFKQKGLNLNPDIVILMYFVNDAEPVPKKHKTVKFSLKKNSYLTAFLFDRFTKIRGKYDTTFDWRNYYKVMYEPNSISLKKNRNSLVEFFTICKDRNIKIIVASIPELRIFEDYPFDYVTNYVSKTCTENNVSFLNLLPALSKYEPSSLWVSTEDFHANEKANFIIAKAIYKKLNQELETVD